MLNPCNGLKLIIGIIKNRNNGEEVGEKYKITIEKLTEQLWINGIIIKQLENYPKKL